MHAKKRTIGVVTGSVAGVIAVAGAAFAAIMLTTSITGATSVTSNKAADQVTGVTVANENGITCNAYATDGGEGLEVEATADELVAGSGQDASGEADGRAGSCEVTIDYKNTGDVPLTYETHQFSVPEGWSVEPVSVSGVSGSSIPAGQSASATVKLIAGPGAQEGPISGKVVTTTAS